MTSLEIVDTASKFVPSITAGFLVGVANYCTSTSQDDSKPHTIRNFIGTTLTCTVISMGVYGVASHFESIGEVTRIGLATIAAFVGLDKFVELIQKWRNK